MRGCDDAVMRKEQTADGRGYILKRRIRNFELRKRVDNLTE